MNTTEANVLDGALRVMEHRQQLLKEARADYYAKLPEFPADGRCPECGSDDETWTYTEEGYFRWTQGEWAGDHLHMHTDGWDDMSEDGQFGYIECRNCDYTTKVPDHLAWD